MAELPLDARGKLLRADAPPLMFRLCETLWDMADGGALMWPLLRRQPKLSGADETSDARVCLVRVTEAGVFSCC
eukprot:scaffold69_cov248-Pinguiococcus_pyrenoidosus.AAC.62